MRYSYEDSGERKAALRDVRKIVIKVGTRLLTDIKGASGEERTEQLIAQIARLRARGLDIILVSSGAIGAALTVLETRKRPSSLPLLQAYAAIGQCKLMSLYEKACVEHGFHCGQLLLTAEDVKSRSRHLNVVCCLDALLGKGILPIINENDSVSVEEIKFGDNDVLAALVASMIRADLTVLLTTVDGMREVRGDEGLGRRISVVPSLCGTLKAMATGTDGNVFSVGGMATKVEAAGLVARAGEPVWIADGRDFAVLNDIADGRDVGTLFLPAQSTRMRAHKRYLAFFSGDKGTLVVDGGAERALVNDGRSLLPRGIVDVVGSFKRGDTVRIVGEAGAEIARGVTNYASTDAKRIMGHHTSEIRDLLGHDAYDSVVHRDHLVLTG